MTAIKHVGVVGAGQMGRGITEVCARAGLHVTLCDVTEDRARAGLAGVADSLLKAEKRGALAPEDRAHVLAGISVTDDLSLLGGADLVVEAAVEDERAKTALFRHLGEVVRDPAAVLASNTSSIPIARLAAAAGRPQTVVGLHFFNPVPVMPLVEVVPSLHTSKATELRVRTFADEILGKKTIVAQDRAGFVVNSLLIPYLLAAVRMVGSGTATAEDIDRRLRPPDGPAAPGRPHRAGHRGGDRRGPVRGVPGTAVRPSPAAAPHGRVGPAGPQVGAGFLQLSSCLTARRPGGRHGRSSRPPPYM
jgi:3-hydroxybutyryl-CoA dehydrogenase